MTESPQHFDVVTLGNYTKDTIVDARGTHHADGGGVAYAAHAAHALGRRVAAVTRLAAEDFHVVRDLEEAGITVYPTATPSSTLMRLEYPTSNPDERILTVADTAGSYTPDQLPQISADTFVISPSFRGEVPIETLRALHDRGSIVAVDSQGFIRVRRPDGRLEHVDWPEQTAVLGLVDILKADVVEAEALTGEKDMRRAVSALADLGPREIVITHKDGIVVLADGEFLSTEFHVSELVGRSGRGDTCVGSYAAARLEHPPREAILWSAAVTSLKMEAAGPIRRRYEDIVDLLDRAYRGAAVSESS